MILSWSISAGSLPPGLSLGSSGAISGTPTTAGAYSFIVQATDQKTGFVGRHRYVLQVSLAITPATLTAGTHGTPYSQQLTATGAVGAVAWSITSGALPGGVTLSATGLIAGTPAATGSYTFTVLAVDAGNNWAKLAYTWTVN
jgi:hypothetical protein